MDDRSAMTTTTPETDSEHLDAEAKDATLSLVYVCVIAFLSGLGLLMVYSASLTTRTGQVDETFILKQITFLIAGVVVAMICAKMPVIVWKRAAPALFVASVVLILLVLIPPFGVSVNGARRWFRFGGVSFQPSELLKITLPMSLCWLLGKVPEVKWGNWKALLTWKSPAVIVGSVILVPMMLIAMEPDLGTALFVATGGVIALIVWGWSVRLFLFGGLAMLPLVGLGLILKPYQMKRITGYFDAIQDISNAPYQLKQSLITLGSGGLWGVGLGRGTQKLSFLPEANNDFVFAVIGEELGLLVTLCIPLLWVIFFVTGLSMLQRAKEDRFAFVLGFTLLCQIVLQALINTAVVTALVPPKGISHPLLSYGGSNLVVTLMACGLIYGCGRAMKTQEPAEVVDDEDVTERLAA